MYMQRLSLSILATWSLQLTQIDGLPLSARASGGSFLQQILQEIISVNNTYAPHITNSLLSDLLPSGGPYTITQNAPNPLTRAAAIDVKRTTFLYGPAVAGGPYFPNGPLGLAKVGLDVVNIQTEITPELTNAGLDDSKATADIAKYDGLKTLEDYTKLYDGEWQLTLPRGPDPGVLTNYTSDLLFSMERLSNSPYQVRRLVPSQDSVPFQVSSSTAKKVCGAKLSTLLANGRLFYADYRDQSKLTPTAQYAAASDALFCIDTSSGDFLPLAIRTNTGAGPIYTPDDTSDDWLSAKIMMNADDFWFAQFNHLASTHEVAHIAYMAAIRTLSEDHPVQAVLDRFMYEVFAIQPLAKSVLFDPGAAVDQVFAYTGSSAQSYSTDRYFNKGAGQFEANYFQTELQNRGLINSAHGPELKNFPFYEDASVIHNAMSKFMTSFVNSYYSSDSVVANDDEIQNWATEASGPAKAIDFPKISSRQTLSDVLTHLAYLVSASHHTINTNELLSMSSALPFHTASLYKKPPTSKSAKGTGVNPVEYLPPFNQVVDSLTVAALFARPLLVNTNRTLLHMFDDADLLQNMNSQTKKAAATFQQSMTAFSKVVGARTFDSNGLSQGMPFVWQALDPNVAPFSVST